MRKIFKAFAAEQFKSLPAEFLKQGASLAWPYIATALTAVLGYVQGIQWMWVWVGAIASFSFFTNAMLRFSELRQRQRIDDKFVFLSASVAIDIKSKDNVLVGLSMLNRGLVDID